MSSVYSKHETRLKNKKIDEIIRLYLKVLNSWQRDVDLIRKMHHEIWKESRVYPIIKQHRAGSRVEKQLRVLPTGKQTDVDYKFEVKDIEVNCDEEKSGMYWKVSKDSSAHGKLFITEEYKKELQSKKHYCEIFSDEVFELDQTEGNFLVKPDSFKENVVRMSGFQYKKSDQTTDTVTSPSVPGQGAVNEYDVVPCLRLKKWPSVASEWSLRGDESENYALNKKWKRSITETVPLFLVPTGNPLSSEREKEFRLSFSQVEVKCFEQVTTRIRKYYGLGKYMYKKVLEQIDYLDSYHIKTLLFWMAEDCSKDVWKKMTSTTFLETFFEKINEACKQESVEHFFVTNCNIFPRHKKQDRKVEQYQTALRDLPGQIEEQMSELLRNDLGLPEARTIEILLKEGSQVLEVKGKSESKNAYISGYLTRLLSVITFSLYENDEQETLLNALDRIQQVFYSYRADEQINRMIPMVNATILQMSVNGHVPQLLYFPELEQCDGDVLSEKAHLAFEAYIHGQLKEVEALVHQVVSFQFHPNNFGVSVTSYHKEFKMDEQLHFIIRTLESESKDGKCPRFYLDPFLLIKHLHIQMEIVHGNNINIEKLLSELGEIAEKLSDKSPYLGKLSYKFAAMYLLHGYAQYPVKGIRCNQLVLQKYPMGCFNQRMFAANFDLR